MTVEKNLVVRCWWKPQKCFDNFLDYSRKHFSNLPIFVNHLSRHPEYAQEAESRKPETSFHLLLRHTQKVDSYVLSADTAWCETVSFRVSDSRSSAQLPPPQTSRTTDFHDWNCNAWCRCCKGFFPNWGRGFAGKSEKRFW